MTSLMDVMFLVLVFFIYCIFDMAVHKGLKVDLPNAAGADEKGERIVITIKADDSIQLNGMEMKREDVVSRVKELNAVKKKYSLPERYILNVGTLEERKNVMLVVKALSSVDSGMKLVLVGRHTPYTDHVMQYAREHGLADRIQEIGNADFRDLPSIYRLAKVFVYPSRFEGFGIPIIEALNSRVPVIAATGSCLEEAGGPDQVYVNPDDVSAMAEQLNRLLGDPALCAQIAAKGWAWSQKFGEHNTAAGIYACYKSLINQ